MRNGWEWLLISVIPATIDAEAGKSKFRAYYKLKASVRPCCKLKKRASCDSVVRHFSACTRSWIPGENAGKTQAELGA